MRQIRSSASNSSGSIHAPASYSTTITIDQLTDRQTDRQSSNGVALLVIRFMLSRPNGANGTMSASATVWEPDQRAGKTSTARTLKRHIAQPTVKIRCSPIEVTNFTAYLYTQLALLPQFHLLSLSLNAGIVIWLNRSLWRRYTTEQLVPDLGRVLGRVVIDVCAMVPSTVLICGSKINVSAIDSSYGYVCNIPRSSSKKTFAWSCSMNGAGRCCRRLMRQISRCNRRCNPSSATNADARQGYWLNVD